MKKTLLLMIVITINFLHVHAEDSRLFLTGWGVPGKDIDEFVKKAADVGFDALIVGNNIPLVKSYVEAGKKYGVQVFSCVTPMGAVAAKWKKKFPDKPIPWQVMNEGELAGLNFLKAGKNKSVTPYQWGGEPVMTDEVLLYNIVCFNNPEAKKLIKEAIDEAASVSGLAGIAFDGFGYQNYTCCRCDKCREKLKDYQRLHPEKTEAQAKDAYFRELLVDYINELSDYVRTRNPKLKTTIHIWPVFVPEPLYGNRLNVDFCGQTAAWYTLWPKEKIEAYSRIISGQARKYYPRQQGVGMIGYYDKQGVFPVKDASRVEMELRTMIQNGCSRIQVCGARDVINNPDVSKIFKKFFK